jgi:hypothetical protein
MTQAQEQKWEPIANRTPIAPLHPETTMHWAPLIRHRRDDGVIRGIEMGHATLELDEENGERVTLLGDALAEGQPLHLVAEQLERPFEEVSGAACDLFRLGVLEATSTHDIGALAFHDHITATARTLRARLLERLPPPHRSSQRFQMGNLIETYHFVQGASVNISPAIALAPSDRVRLILCEFLGHEYSHGATLRAGLLAAGMTDAQIDRGDPLPATQGLLNQLRWLATTNLLAYAACLTTCESNGPDDDAYDATYYSSLCDRLDKKIYEPYIMHVTMDRESDHGSVGREIFAESGPLGRIAQDAIRRGVLALEQFSYIQQRQIDTFYGPEEGPVIFTVDALWHA